MFDFPQAFSSSELVLKAYGRTANASIPATDPRMHSAYASSASLRPVDPSTAAPCSVTGSVTPYDSGSGPELHVS